MAAALARDGFKMAPKGQDRQNHSGRCFCLRGAYAELPRGIASQIPNVRVAWDRPVSGHVGLVLGPSWGHLERPHKRHCLKPSKPYKATPPSHETAVSILDSVCYHLLALPGARQVPGAKCASTQCHLPDVHCPGAHKTYARLGHAQLALCTCCQAYAGASANLPPSLRAQGFSSFELTCISSPCEPIEEDLWNNAHV